MRVQFEFTTEDCVDASKRFLERSDLLKWKWQWLLLTALLVWATASLVCVVIVPLPPSVGLMIGLFLAILNSFFYPSSYRRGVEKRLRRLHRKQFGAASSLTCEVDLTEVGVWTRQMDRQTTYEWESVEEVIVTDDSVDIFARNCGGVVVRKRAFKSLEEQWQFVGLAKKFIEQSHQAQAEQ